MFRDGIVRMDTVPSRALATYAVWLCGCIAILLGSRPTGISDCFLSPWGSARNTVIVFAVGFTFTNIGPLVPSAIGLDCEGWVGPDAALAVLGLTTELAPAKTRNGNKNAKAKHALLRSRESERIRPNPNLIEAPPEQHSLLARLHDDERD